MLNRIVIVSGCIDCIDGNHWVFCEWNVGSVGCDEWSFHGPGMI